MSNEKNTDIMQELQNLVASNGGNPERIIFDATKDVIARAIRIGSFKKEGFIWLCDNVESWCLPEKDVFIRGTAAHELFRLFGVRKCSHLIVAIIDVFDVRDGIYLGTVKTVEIKDYLAHVLEVALPANAAGLAYEGNVRELQNTQIGESFKFERFEEFAADMMMLRQILLEEYTVRHNDYSGNAAAKTHKLSFTKASEPYLKTVI